MKLFPLRRNAGENILRSREREKVVADRMRVVGEKHYSAERAGVAQLNSPHPASGHLLPVERGEGMLWLVRNLLLVPSFAFPPSATIFISMPAAQAASAFSASRWLIYAFRAFAPLRENFHPGPASGVICHLPDADLQALTFRMSLLPPVVLAGGSALWV
jgi:hypothetical protein